MLERLDRHVANSRVVVLKEFSSHCSDLLKMVLNPKPGEVQEMPDRCYHFFTRHVNHADEQSSWDNNIITEYSEQIADALKFAFGFDGALNYNLPAVVYPEGCGMGLHDDMYHNSDNPATREKVHVYSSVHYLNDDYDGGELVFPDIGLTIKPEANMLLLFPCEHRHEGLPSTNGIKVSSTKFWRDKHAV